MKNLALFSDGACSGNPGPGGWAYLLWDLDSDSVYGESGAREKTTNNQMEILSLTEALKTLRRQWTQEDFDLQILSDSKYVIQGATEWSKSWRARGWKTSTNADVANRELWEALLQALDALTGSRLRWTYVPGHSGICGNDFVDEGAVRAAGEQGPRRVLCDGLRKLVPALGALSLEIVGSKAKPKKSSSAKALYYLSLLDGKLLRHESWADCEARVRGKSGAKYKKVSQVSEEDAILRGWGLK